MVSLPTSNCILPLTVPSPSASVTPNWLNISVKTSLSQNIGTTNSFISGEILTSLVKTLPPTQWTTPSSIKIESGDSNCQITFPCSKVRSPIDALSKRSFWAGAERKSGSDGISNVRLILSILYFFSVFSNLPFCIITVIFPFKPFVSSFNLPSRPSSPLM